ncbi:MAG: hypothetical protein LBH00_00895 [Planctomycetaceae bacterium]|nr:hypothetical protein [Planctomycetaceae bacterium]
MKREKNPISLFSFQDIIMSVVGIVILMTLILILQLVSRMSAAPPSPVISVQELKQQIDALHAVKTELQNAVAELHQAREQSESVTPSQEKIDALQSTVARLESDIAATEKKLDETQKKSAELRKNPAMQEIADLQQEIKKQHDTIAELEKQKKDISVTETELQAKVQELRAKNAALAQKIAEHVSPQVKVTIPQDMEKTAYILLYGQGTISVIATDGSPRQTFSSASRFYDWAGKRNTAKEFFVIYVRPSRFGQQDEVIKNLQARGFEVGLQVIGEKTDLQTAE